MIHGLRGEKNVKNRFDFVIRGGHIGGVLVSLGCLSQKVRTSEKYETQKKRTSPESRAESRAGIFLFY